MSSNKAKQLWDDVTLTPEEIEEATKAALNEARRIKYWRLQDAEKEDKQQQHRANLIRDWTPAELLAYATLQRPDFVIDQRNVEIVNLLAQYFTGDPAFEACGNYNLNKGILLMGDVGVGKTDLMRFFKVNKRMCYGITSCASIAGRYAEERHEVLADFQTNMDHGEGDPRILYQRQTGWCFDDLGIEDLKKNFGNQLNVMANIMLERYEDRHRVPFFSTHMTTNLSKSEIRQAYGNRVASRIPEMFNLIVLEGEDRRRRKSNRSDLYPIPQPTPVYDGKRLFAQIGTGTTGHFRIELR